jgi:hypothetical protein
MRWRYEGRSSWKHPVAAGGLVGARSSLGAGGRLVKRLSDVRAAQTFLGSELASVPRAGEWRYWPTRGEGPPDHRPLTTPSRFIW